MITMNNKCPKKWKSYVFHYKLKVIEKGNELGNQEAARQFQVDKKNACQWKKREKNPCLKSIVGKGQIYLEISVGLI